MQLDPRALALDAEFFAEAQRAWRERVLPSQRVREPRLAGGEPRRAAGELGEHRPAPERALEAPLLHRRVELGSGVAQTLDLAREAPALERQLAAKLLLGIAEADEATGLRELDRPTEAGLSVDDRVAARHGRLRLAVLAGRDHNDRHHREQQDQRRVDARQPPPSERSVLRAPPHSEGDPA